MTISVLIPAYRPTYLGVAIASALTQGYGEFELLIHDDSGGDEVAKVVERFADPRIIYSQTAGNEGSAENIRQLWDRAQHDLVKYLFDDDLLLPHALVTLIDSHDKHPTASFYFGHRDIIDDRGRITSEPRFIREGAEAVLTRDQISESLIATCHNRIGELSNVLINRGAGVNLDDLFCYQGHEVAMLVDVALFLNGSEKSQAIGLGRTIGQYRKHANQNSSFGFNKEFYKSLFEWDIFLRGEYASGRLSGPRTLAGIQKLSSGYLSWSMRLPELNILREGLQDFASKVEREDRDVFDDHFRQTWARADGAARAREAAALKNVV